MLQLAMAIALGTTTQTATLHYGFAPAQLRCPDEAWVLNAIRGRLGADPFVPDGALELTATIRQEDKALVGELRVRSGDAPESVRTMTSKTQDCFELASALELAMTVVIDPLWLAAPAPAPAPRLPAMAISAELVGTAGAVPGATAGLGVGAQVRWPAFALGLDARVHWPTRVLFAGGEASTLLALGSLQPCLALGGLQACAVLSGGLIRVTGTTSLVTRATVPFAAAGLGASWGFRLAPRLWLRPFLEVEVMLSRLVIGAGPVDLWVSAPVSGTVGLKGELPIQ